MAPSHLDVDPDLAEDSLEKCDSYAASHRCRMYPIAECNGGYEHVVIDDRGRVYWVSVIGGGEGPEPLALDFDAALESLLLGIKENREELLKHWWR